MSRSRVVDSRAGSGSTSGGIRHLSNAGFWPKSAGVYETFAVLSPAFGGGFPRLTPRLFEAIELSIEGADVYPPVEHCRSRVDIVTDLDLSYLPAVFR